jgi:hypothetical protein
MKQVVSISRRTDIPAHYLDWLIERIDEGTVEVVNPFNPAQWRTVSLRPEDVHTLVFWSKDYGRLLRELPRFEKYPNLLLHFTINDCPMLEPRIPPLPERLTQAETIVKTFGPERLAWRFDPLVFWNNGENDNIESFERIAEFVAGLGVGRCTFSFAQWYNKCVRRAKKLGFDYYDPPLAERLEAAESLAQTAKGFGIVMQSCCGDDLTGVDNVEKAHCIDGGLLYELAGEPCDTRRDTSQRKMCGCTKSVDIGSYSDQRCLHGCLYCYANPAV